MISKYEAENGKLFDSAEECIAYEKAIMEERKKKEKLRAERVNREKEIQDAYTHYCNLVEDFYKDYGTRVTENDINRLFKMLGI